MTTDEYTKNVLKFIDDALKPISIVHVIDPDDPTPWCSWCGARTKDQFDCGPRAENE